MAATAIDSIVLGDLFSTPAMRRIFADKNRIQIYLDIEAALARVEARLGVIPEQAAAEIIMRARADNIDFDRLARRATEVGSAVIPLIEQLRALCSDDLGQYCHFGATTQDIMDTGATLQIRLALALVDEELGAIARALAALARRYRDTPMAGRTKLQHAAPITFGFKMAAALDAIQRHRERLTEIRPRALVGQFGGAVGTLAALGADGLKVESALMDELGLGRPAIAWHAHRDRFAEVGCFLALTAGTLGKIATDTKLMMQTEVGEAFEPSGAGRGSSSTMPQKRNPVSCNYIVACAAMVRRNASALLEAMIEDHERGTGPWEIEWVALPEIFLLASGALAQTRYVLEGLRVDEARMRANLDSTHGLIAAEAVMMGIAPHFGRARAHEIVSAASRVAMQSGRRLADALADNGDVSRHLDRAALERLCDPANYLGSAGEIVDRVLKSFASE